MSTTTTPAWPTVERLAEVGNTISGDVLDPIETLRIDLHRLVDLDLAPSIVGEPPSLRTLGALTACVAKLRFDLEIALEEVSRLEQIRDVLAIEVDVHGEANDDAS